MNLSPIRCWIIHFVIMILAVPLWGCSVPLCVCSRLLPRLYLFSVSSTFNFPNLALLRLFYPSDSRGADLLRLIKTALRLDESWSGIAVRRVTHWVTQLKFHILSHYNQKHWILFDLSTLDNTFNFFYLLKGLKLVAFVCIEPPWVSTLKNQVFCNLSVPVLHI